MAGIRILSFILVKDYDAIFFVINHNPQDLERQKRNENRRFRESV